MLAEAINTDKTTAPARASAASPFSGGRASGRFAAPIILGLPVLAWQAAFFLTPLLFLLVITFWKVANFRLAPAFIFDNWEKVFASAPFYRALSHTIEVSAVTTMLGLLIALPVARTIAFRLSARHRDLAVALLIIPVFSSYILRVYAWQIVLSPQGVVNSLLALLGIEALPLLGGPFALQVGLLTLTLPIAILILVFALLGLTAHGSKRPKTWAATDGGHFCM